ncbi:hypothetical protein KIPB_004952 [Kipferlia bialata]|uniref:Uncharacterized protein n=1 Tax=Kipferlia bialata TaxID=797122 RepID=A0A391NW26_9EUKA|nr:hypothetical protein KIPB_004952 [Kipferlia bialata]|eukprot:g4952.t1
MSQHMPPLITDSTVLDGSYSEILHIVATVPQQFFLIARPTTVASNYQRPYQTQAPLSCYHVRVNLDGTSQRRFLGDVPLYMNHDVTYASVCGYRNGAVYLFCEDKHYTISLQTGRWYLAADEDACGPGSEYCVSEDETPADMTEFMYNGTICRTLGYGHPVQTMSLSDRGPTWGDILSPTCTHPELPGKLYVVGVETCLNHLYLLVESKNGRDYTHYVCEYSVVAGWDVPVEVRAGPHPRLYGVCGRHLILRSHLGRFHVYVTVSAEVRDCGHFPNCAAPSKVSSHTALSATQILLAHTPPYGECRVSLLSLDTFLCCPMSCYVDVGSGWEWGILPVSMLNSTGNDEDVERDSAWQLEQDQQDMEASIIEMDMYQQERYQYQWDNYLDQDMYDENGVRYDDNGLYLPDYDDY